MKFARRACAVPATAATVVNGGTVAGGGVGGATAVAVCCRW